MFTIPSHGWFMALLYPHYQPLSKSSVDIRPSVEHVRLDLGLAIFVTRQPCLANVETFTGRQVPQRQGNKRQHTHVYSINMFMQKTCLYNIVFNHIHKRKHIHVHQDVHIHQYKSRLLHLIRCRTTTSRPCLQLPGHFVERPDDDMETM